MPQRTERAAPQAIGPDGHIITAESLPPSNRVRWNPRRKAEIVIAVLHGIVTFSEVRERYAISEDEFLDWQDRYSRGGMPALERGREPRRMADAQHAPETRTHP